MNNHDKARKALDDMMIEVKDAAVFEADPNIIKPIFDLVAAQDAQIAALHHTALALLESDENTGGNAGQMFYDALDKTLLDTKQAAFAFESRIRADERERCAKIADNWTAENQFKGMGDKKRFSDADMQIAARTATKLCAFDIRAMKGEGK